MRISGFQAWLNGRLTYLPPYLRSPNSAKTTAAGPGSDVAQIASAYTDKTTIAMSWEMDVVPMDGEPQKMTPSMHRDIAAKFTIFGTSKYQG